MSERHTFRIVGDEDALILTCDGEPADGVTVVCVLRSGGCYDATWVRRLHRQVTEHLDAPHDFCCLTDMEVEGVATVPLEHDWAGWWAKACLFAPGLFDGPVVYLDLDTLIVGDVTPMASYDGPFATLRDFGDPRISASGVMAWDGRQPPPIYEAALDDPPPHRGRFDLWWNRKVWTPDHLQDLHPGVFGSYKLDGLEDGPGGYATISFHGVPKMHELPGTWVERAWRGTCDG